MMINWAEKQRLKTVKSNEDVLDAMTQYRVEEPKLCQSEDEQEQQDSA